MKPTHLIAALLCWPLLGAAAPTDNADAQLARYFKHLAAYDRQFTQEKVYLHLDNRAYFLNEKLWFKAYVTRASSLMPTDLSHVLYVELLNENGQLIERKQYELEQGQANGNFDLSELIESGYYELRAYTRAQLNWDGAYTYSRVVPVFDVPQKAGDYSRPQLYEAPVGRRESATRPEARVSTAVGTVERGPLGVALFPEGGHRVEGADCVLAFKACDSRGDANYTTARLYDAAGTVVATARAEHAGMGALQLRAGQSYARLTFTDAGGREREFALPQAEADGVAMHVDEEADSLVLTLTASPTMRNQRLGLSVMCRGGAAYFSTVTLQTAPHRVAIARSNLHDGINQITLFAPTGRVLAERLAWQQPERAAGLVVRQNQTSYAPFAPVVLDMQLNGAQGRPARAYFSLAVRESAGDVGGSEDRLATDLLLAGDLRGYIDHPEYYMQAGTDARRALDLLLMVQGYRRYDWSEMAGVKTFNLREPVEEGQLLCGQVLSRSSKRQPLAGVDLSFVISAGDLQAVASVKTDAQGRFALLPSSYYGVGWGSLSVRQGGQLRSCRITLDRDFAPALLPFDPRQRLIAPPDSAPAPQTVATFQWTDTLPTGGIKLREITVKDSHRQNFAMGRFNWNGGEEAGRRAANTYYNIEEETRKVLDRGDDVPLLWEWLKEHDKQFDYSAEGERDYEFTYKTRPVPIYVNNRRLGDSSNAAPENSPTIFMDEVKSLYVVFDRSKSENLGGQMDDNAQAAIYLYTFEERSIEKVRKGTRVTSFRGYEPPVTFPSPDYRRIDAANPEDFRRTLYWNPDVLTDADGHASVLFFSNARPNQRLRITARAVLPDGSLLDYDL